MSSVVVVTSSCWGQRGSVAVACTSAPAAKVAISQSTLVNQPKLLVYLCLLVSLTSVDCFCRGLVLRTDRLS